MAIDLGLSGARAIVVGAGFMPDHAGHGFASALNLADAGAIVACLDLNERRAKGTAQGILDRGGQAFPVVGDARDSRDITRAINAAVEQLGGLDVVVDIVGAVRWGLAGDISNEDWDSQILVNLTQVFYVFRAAIPHLKAGGRGLSGSSFIALASADGLQSSHGHSHYGAAKAGLINLAMSWAEEYGPDGVRVNIVAPGNVGADNFTAPRAGFGSDPVNPLAPPRGQDIANAVIFLSSALADRITGQTILVDGGSVMRSAWGSMGDRNALAERMTQTFDR
jgi:NAD(P)-dependent dehydrogenase (short-subunit alcohol dehydrogenase family)